MKHVALIFGGPSAEHDVSLVSAKNIFQALKDTSLQIHLLGVTREGQWKLVRPEDLLSTSFQEPTNLEKAGIDIRLIKTGDSVFLQPSENSEEKVGPIDVAFPIVHGPYGEDGKLQAELNELGLEFVGSDFISCENSFDKEKTKKIIEELGVPQVPWLVFSDENPNYNDIKEKLGLPFFVKPANMGSSVGISKVKNEKQFMTAIAEARIHDKKIVIEKAVIARELETALLETDQLTVAGVGELKPSHEFYSYEAKYLDPKGAEICIPADISEEIKIRIQDYAKRCFEGLGCRDYSRADFFLTSEGEVFFNEINTHPGFTSISLFPQLWDHEGIQYKDLIVLLLNQAEKRKKSKT